MLTIMKNTFNPLIKSFAGRWGFPAGDKILISPLRKTVLPKDILTIIYKSTNWITEINISSQIEFLKYFIIKEKIERAMAIKTKIDVLWSASFQSGYDKRSPLLKENVTNIVPYLE